MRTPEIISNKAVTASFDSNWFSLEDLRDYSIEVVFNTGSTLAGELWLYSSNTTAKPSKIDESKQVITSGHEIHLWNVYGATYKYVRVAWVHTSGSGTMTATLGLKDFIVRHG